MTTRVVIAEDSYLVREGVVRLLEAQEGIEVVGACGDYDELIATVDAAVEDLQAEAAAQCQRMEEAVERALSGALVPLAEQAAAMAATLDSGRGLAEAIAAQAHDLEIAPRIVAEIDRLLQAVE